MKFVKPESFVYEKKLRNGKVEVGINFFR